MNLFRSDEFAAEFGVVTLENWPEGIVLWVGGRIRWKSWEANDFLCTRLSERAVAAKEIAGILAQIPSGAVPRVTENEDT